MLGLAFEAADIHYPEQRQWGFLGTGTASTSFLDGPLDAWIDLHDGVIDVRMGRNEAVGLDLGWYASFGAVSAVRACLRIDGPLIDCFTMYAMMAESISIGGPDLLPWCWRRAATY